MPHLFEAIIGGLVTGVPFAVIGWLQRRDMNTRLVVKSEDHDKRLDKHGAALEDHESRIVRLETLEEGHPYHAD